MDAEIMACERYAFANVGEVRERWGFLWPMCPRWYVEHAGAPARVVVDRILAWDRHLRLGVADRVVGGKLTPIAEDLWWRVHTFIDHLDNVRRERERAARG